MLNMNYPFIYIIAMGGTAGVLAMIFTHYLCVGINMLFGDYDDRNAPDWHD